MPYTFHDIAKMIDHSLCCDHDDQGRRHGAGDPAGAAVRRGQRVHPAVLPEAVRRAARAAADVQASTTIGFPHGGHTTAIKLAEARQALADGGIELDMVVNISAGAQRRLGLRPPRYRRGDRADPRCRGRRSR